MSNAPYSYDLHSARVMMQNNRDGWTIAAKELWELVRSDLACFDETKNPLFLWGALFNILVNAANPEENGEAVISKAVTIPPTIANYLMHVAFSLRLLSYGQPRKLPITKDWVAQLNPALPKKVASKIALGAVPGVLGLGGKQGSSAFDQMYEYSRCIYDAIEYEGLIGKGISSQGALQEMLRQKTRNITTRRLQARIRVGRRLLKVAIPPTQKAP